MRLELNTTKDKVKLAIAGAALLAAVVIIVIQIMPSSPDRTATTAAANKPVEQVTIEPNGEKAIKRGSRAYIETGSNK